VKSGDVIACGRWGSGFVIEVLLGDVVLGHFAGADLSDIGIGGIFYTGEDSGFIRVALFDQFLNAFRVCEGRVVDLLQIAGLAGGIGAGLVEHFLPGIRHEVVSYAGSMLRGEERCWRKQKTENREQGSGIRDQKNRD
jgi:hypothetical protein